MNINGQRISSHVGDPVWPGPDLADTTGLPERLIESPVEDWRSHRWDFPDRRSGIYPDAVSRFGSDTAAWSGFLVRDGRAYQYEMTWYRVRDSVSLILSRRRRTIATLAMPLSAFFPFPECELELGKTTVGHIEYHIDPASELALRGIEAAWVARNDAAHGDDFDSWERQVVHPDPLAGHQMLWNYAKRSLARLAPAPAEDEADAEVEARVAAVPADGPGLTYAGLKNAWDVGDRQTMRIAQRLMEMGLVRDNADQPSKDKRKRFWRAVAPEPADGSDG